MNTLLQDLKYGMRTLLNSPGFTVIAVLTLALGIGANSTIFSWINATVLNPVPGVRDISKIAELAAGTPSNPTPLSYPDYLVLRDKNHTLSSLMAFSLRPMDLTGTDKPRRVWGEMASANYFDALDLHPFLGRTFIPEEGTRPGGAPVVVLSYQLWETQFAADRSIIGKTIEIDKNPFTVVGVAPQGFKGTQTGTRADLWVPAVMIQEFTTGNGNLLEDRNIAWLMSIGRLKPGVTRAQAQADLSNIFGQLAKEYPDSHRGTSVATLYPMSRAPWGANYYLGTILFLLMAISGVILLLACANVANLMLVRGVSLRREMAIRLSIGATRWRLIRQLLAESLMLSLCGGAIAMILTLWTAGVFGEFIPQTSVPIDMNFHADRTVFFATLVISVLAGVIFGILPALRSSSMQPVAVLKEETGSSSSSRKRARLSSLLTVAQIAMSLLLLICAGLFIRSFRVQEQLNPGFRAEGVLIESYDLGGVGYNEKTGLQFDRQLLDRLDAIPGVKSAALSSWIPMSMTISRTKINPSGYAPKLNESMSMRVTYVSPDYLRTMQIPLLEGREFTTTDTPDTQLVAMVDQEFVQLYWPGQQALGKKLQANDKWFTVVGVTKNFDTDSLGESPKAIVYLPLLQDYAATVAIHLRVDGKPMAFVNAVEGAVHSLDADLPLSDLSTLENRIEISTTPQRIGGTFVGAFGVLALILATVGVYGVLAYTTRQRTHELGIRMALGAEPRGIFRLVLRQGAILAATGIAIGLLLSFVLTRALANVLYGVSTTDPLTYTAVSIVLVAAALTAGYVPARRASKVDPMVALRYE